MYLKASPTFWIERAAAAALMAPGGLALFEWFAGEPALAWLPAVKYRSVNAVFILSCHLVRSDFLAFLDAIPSLASTEHA